MRGLTAAIPLLLAAAAVSQQTLLPANPDHGAIRAEKDGMVLPAGDFTAAELIEATARYLNRNYLYDHGLIGTAASFTLQRKLAVDALGAEELLYALLASRQFAVMPVDELRGVYGIVSLSEPHRGAPMPHMAAPWRAPERILRRPQLHEIVLTHVAVQSGAARDIANMLRMTVTPGGWRPGMLLATAGNEHLLMLHGYRDQVASAIRLTQQIDRAALPRQQALLQRIEALERRLAELERAGR